MPIVLASSRILHTRKSKVMRPKGTRCVDRKTMAGLLQDVQDQFGKQLDTKSLLSLSRKLQEELRQHLISSPQCMLPSFNYNLPTSQEKGTYLALEVGGSNLRMALVELHGDQSGNDSMQIRRTMSFPIDPYVRRLLRNAFFDWMAARIREMLVSEGENREDTKHIEPLRMGVAWSFPIDQTSIRSGAVLGMGKGFLCSDAVKGLDLGDVITQACQRANLNVHLEAIINDSASALLAQAYIHPATRLAIILGTGMNAAIHLPTAALHPSKFDTRQLPSSVETTYVLTNTELSMFGKNIFPTTKWDEKLNTAHLKPNYQPFEYLIAGGYLGEIVRLIIVEATETAGLFGGVLPPSLRTPYSLDTRTLALIEIDSSPSSFTALRSMLNEQPPTTPLTLVEKVFIRQIVLSVTRRSMFFFTAGIHALASLLEDVDASAGLKNGLDPVSIGCDGSVINKYPGYMDRAQQMLGMMIEMEGAGKKRILLEKTKDSAVLGAGVAVAMAAQISSQ